MYVIFTLDLLLMVVQSEESGIYRHYVASTAERDGIPSHIIPTLVLQTCMYRYLVHSNVNLSSA